MQISFVIPAYNEETYLGDCLDSIIDAAEGRSVEIIVVDNASTDRTSEIAQAKRGVRVVSEKRKGITFARQRGLMEARGELLAYLDADTRLPRGWIELVEKTFQVRSDLVAVSGPYWYYDGGLFSRILANLSSLIALPIGKSCFGYMLVGGNYVVKKESLNEIGGFDTSIDFFGEDTNIGRRLFDKGPMLFYWRLFVFSSGRRFYSDGILKTNFLYLINYLFVSFGFAPLSKSHRDIRDTYPNSPFGTSPDPDASAKGLPHRLSIIRRTFPRKRLFTFHPTNRAIPTDKNE